VACERVKPTYKYKEKEVIASRKGVLLQLKLNILKNRMLRNLSQNLGLGRIFAEML